MSFKLFENIGLGEFDLSILIIIMLIMIIRTFNLTTKE